MTYKVLTASFTRPADTTAYTIGDLVANSVTAASVVPIQFNVGSKGGQVVWIKFANNRTTITNATFTVSFYATNPCATAPTAGDNGALATKEAGLLGIVPLTIMVTNNDFGSSIIKLGDTNFLSGVYVPNSTGTLYALVKAAAAYTPASAEVFTLSIGVQN